jgi:class 3 adenylate cyclase/tetratricopeptide (TPR) repeat protein/tRNA A-37 threonylcarbamoyl transferase component Bud32
MDTDLPDKSVVLTDRHRTDVVALVFTDIVGSTSLKHQLGDRTGVSLIQRHHAVVRECLAGFPAGKEVETAGDSFLIAFSTPSAAVEFALLLQARVRVLSKASAVELQDRVGIHLGEVVVQEHARGLKPRDLYGIQVDVSARLMDLAQGGQILLTRSAFDSARQMLKGEDVAGVGPLEWLNHGPYLLKGIEASLEVCEVGEVGIAPLQAPAGSEKAHRQATAESEPVLGWRPAVGQLVPNTRWRLENKLGEGGFGEVWLGRHQNTKERRVFKFCFQAERVRFLKREMTLFRLLKERVGDHPNIVRLHDVMLDHPPFYVEMDYVEGADLRSWSQEHGGVESIPVATRLEIMAQAADGLQAAHQAGIIHRDIKPANILVGGKGIGATDVRVKLTDFGIGQVVSEEFLKGITRVGFTQTVLSDSSSSHTGTQIYMAPELLAGKPASTRSDIYSLGVVLYQLLVGDFSRPVTIDWANEISDPLLRDDLKRCFAGRPEQRFAGAGQLAEQLRALPERRAAVQRTEAEKERQQAEKAALQQTAYRRGIMRTAAVAVLIVAAIALLALYAFKQAARAERNATSAERSKLAEQKQRLRAETEKAGANHLLYLANMNLVQQAWNQNDIDRMRQLLQETQDSLYRGFEWSYWQPQTHLALQTLRGHLAGVYSAAFSPNGQQIVTGSDDNTATVWEAASGKPMFTLRGHSSAIWSVAFSPDGQRIVTGSSDHTARVWETARPEQIAAWQEEERAADQYLNALRRQQEIDNQLKANADSLARSGRWAEAAADLARAIEHNPTDHQLWFWLGAIYVQTGQLDAYRENCRKSLQRFSQTTDSETAERIAKDCLILPGSGVNLDTLSTMADTAVTRGQHDVNLPWFQFGKGLAEYRQGRFTSATDRMGTVLTNSGSNFARETEACMVLAMSQHQLGQIEQARASLANGAEIEQKLPKLESGDLGDGWLDWIFAHALMREATAMIGSPPAGAGQNSPARPH